MDPIRLVKQENGEQAFVLEEDGERLAEMVIAVEGNELTVFHTEVNSKLEGKGIGKMLIDIMSEYARENHLKVIPLCPYVFKQFKRHPDLYKDIWKTNNAA
jgi:uncharacterized protein